MINRMIGGGPGVGALDRAPLVSAFGGVKNVFASPSVALQFFGTTPSTDDLTADTTGTGSVSIVDGKINVSSGSDPTSENSVQSNRVLYYYPGHGAYVWFTLRGKGFDGTGGQKINAGGFSDTTGFLVTLEQDSVSVSMRNGSVTDTVERSQFNLDRLDGNGPSGLDLNNGFLNIFLIDFGFLGIYPPSFCVVNASGDIFPVHRFDTINNRIDTHISKPSFPVRVEVVKENGGSADIVAESASWHAGSYTSGQKRPSRPQSDYAYGSIVFPDTSTRVPLVTYRNKSTFQTLDNHILARMVEGSFISEANDTVLLFIVKGGTLSVTPTYTDQDSVNSVIEVGRHASGVGTAIGGSISGGRVIYSRFLGGSGTNNRSISGSGGSQLAEDQGAFLYPGEEATIAFQNLNNASTDLCGSIVFWGEEF